MVTSIFIIAIIVSLFIANYNTANKRTDLIMSAQKLVADIHYAQNNTLGLVKYNDLVPAGGWGLHFDVDNDSYLMFADLNAPGETGYMSYDEGEGEINYGARLTSLSSNIEISSLEIGGAEKTSVNVTFLPPNPQTNIYDGANTSTSLIIGLHDKRSDTTKTVHVNFLGLAEVLD
jgi:hypothetical protein